MFIEVGDDLVFDTADLTVCRCSVDECERYGVDIKSLNLDYDAMPSLQRVIWVCCQRDSYGWRTDGLVSLKRVRATSSVGYLWKFDGIAVWFHEVGGILCVNEAPLGQAYSDYMGLAYMHRGKDGMLYLRGITRDKGRLLFGVAPDGFVPFFVRDGRVLRGRESVGIKAWLTCI